MPRIAISYRREDSASITGRILDRLVAHFGRDSVFRDIENIPLGVDFRDHINTVLVKTDITLVVIGRRWLGGQRRQQRRIDDPSDPVRIEVEMALSLGMNVVPVLVDGRAMPKDEELPESLRNLVYRNGIAIDSGRDFDQHIDRLIRNIEPIWSAAQWRHSDGRPQVQRNWHPEPELAAAEAPQQVEQKLPAAAPSPEPDSNSGLPRRDARSAELSEHRDAAVSPGQALRKIGYLGVEPRPIHDEFRRGLAAYGHVAGKTIEIHYRWSGGVYARYPELLRELVELDVELIVAAATPAVTAAKQATNSIPIVMVEVGDPVAYGIVPSLMRPGANITGISNALHEYAPRALRLFKEILPDATRVAILNNANNYVGGVAAVKSLEDAAHALDMRPRSCTAATADELRTVLAGLDRPSCDVLVVIPDHALSVNRSIIVAAAMALKIPVVCPSPEYVSDGGFMSLGPNRAEVHRRVAYYVDAILKGTPPNELPIEEPTKSTLLFNLKTAKALGIAIPGPILMRADQLIE